MTEKVKVRISGSMEIRYDQVVEMSESEFDRLNELLDEDEDRAEEEIQDWLDLHDINDGETLEVDTFQIVGRGKA